MDGRLVQSVGKTPTSCISQMIEYAAVSSCKLQIALQFSFQKKKKKNVFHLALLQTCASDSFWIKRASTASKHGIKTIHCEMPPLFEILVQTSQQFNWKRRLRQSPLLMQHFYKKHKSCVPPWLSSSGSALGKFFLQTTMQRQH